MRGRGRELGRNTRGAMLDYMEPEIEEVYVIESARYWQIVSQQIIGNANGRGPLCDSSIIESLITVRAFNFHAQSFRHKNFTKKNPHS